MNRFRTAAVSLLAAMVVGCGQSAGPTPAPTPPSAPKAPAAPAAPVATPVARPLLHWQSSGLLSVSNKTDGLRLKEVMALNEAAIVRSNTVRKLAHNLPAILFPEAPTNSVQADKLKPLLEDVLAYESEFVWAGQQPPRWRLTVKIPVERTGIWSMNLHDLLVRGSLTNTIPRTNITGTTYLAAYSADEAYRFGLNDGLIVVERSDTNFNWSAYRKGLPAPETNAWFNLGLQTRLLPVVSDFFAPDNQPYAQLSMESKGENQISRLTLKFPKPTGIQPEPWQVPLQTIRDPIISFTAIQGIDGWWQRQALFKPLGLPSIPRQAYVWAQSDVPVQTFTAFPAKGASNLVTSSVSRWTNEIAGIIGTNLAGRPVNRTNEFGWAGLPVLVPFLKPAPESKDDHLLFGVFPMSPNSTNLPPELLQQFVGRSNSLYYDWEITQNRVTYVMQSAPFLFMSANKLLIANDVSPYNFLKAMAPKLGNSVTEGTLAAPDEIKVTRKSPIGLTGIEIYLLTRWLDQNQFPLWDPAQGAIMQAPATPGAPPTPK